jgi:hypothetical protein
VTGELAIKVTRRAASEIAAANEWWEANRPAAPNVLRQEIERAFPSWPFSRVSVHEL